MKIIRFDQSDGGFPKPGGPIPGYFVKVSIKEALSLISSLADQINKGPISQRLESFTEKGEYFSIAVLTDVEIELERNNVNQS